MLWQDEAHVNAYLNFYRQYVEHSMHLIKDHGMWRVVNSRNSLPVLQACIKITVHLTNVAIKRPHGCLCLQGGTLGFTTAHPTNYP